MLERELNLPPPCPDAMREQCQEPSCNSLCPVSGRQWPRPGGAGDRQQWLVCLVQGAAINCAGRGTCQPSACESGWGAAGCNTALAVLPCCTT